jgi:hypothetical protein
MLEPRADDGFFAHLAEWSIKRIAGHPRTGASIIRTVPLLSIRDTTPTCVQSWPTSASNRAYVHPK